MYRKRVDVIPTHLPETSNIFQVPLSAVSLGLSVLSLWFIHHHGSNEADTLFFFFLLSHPLRARAKTNLLILYLKLQP